jgi:WD40 repeat protein
MIHGLLTCTFKRWLDSRRIDRRTVSLASVLIPLLCVWAFGQTRLAAEAKSPFVRVGEIEGAVESWNLAQPPFNPDGSLVVAESEDSVRVWNLATLKPITAPLVHTGIDCYRISADGKTVFTKGSREVRFWDVATSKLRSETKAADKWIVASDASPDMSRFVAVAREEIDELVGWRVANSKATVYFRHRYPAGVVSAEFDPMGRWIVVQTFDGPFYVLAADTGKPTCPPIESDPEYNPFSSAPFQAQFDPTGKPRLLIPKNSGCEIIDPSTGNVQATAHWQARSADTMRFSADGSLVVITTRGVQLATHGPALLVGPVTGKLLRRFGDGIADCQVSPDGRWGLANLDANPSAVTQLWDLRIGQVVQTFPRAVKGRSLYAAMSPTGTVVAAESSNAVTSIWR